METLIVFALLGLGIGAMYAALAVGVIVVYRATGVVNFALGAQAMFPAVVFAELRTSGDLLLPVVVIPNRYSIGDGLGFWPALVIALAIGANGQRDRVPDHFPAAPGRRAAHLDRGLGRLHHCAPRPGGEVVRHHHRPHTRHPARGFGRDLRPPGASRSVSGLPGWSWS